MCSLEIVVSVDFINRLCFALCSVFLRLLWIMFLFDSDFYESWMRSLEVCSRDKDRSQRDSSWEGED